MTKPVTSFEVSRLTRAIGFSMLLAMTTILAAGSVVAEEANVTDDQASQSPRPVTAFRDGFTLDEVRSYRNERSALDVANWFSGGDASVWFNLRSAEAFPATAVVPNRLPPVYLARNINAEIGAIRVETENFGAVTLDEFMANPAGRGQAFMVVHRGEVVYENFTGVRPTDNHLWMSVAKVVAGLLIDQLISEGEIDELETMGTYVPGFRDTAWESVSVKDVMDMTTGLNVEEMVDGVSYAPGTIGQRVLLAEFGVSFEGEPELLLDVLRDAEPNKEAGSQFDYSSAATQALVYLAEAVTGTAWADLVDDKIWSHLHAEGPLLVHTSPDGIAIGHGMVASRLSDLARFGMLYTPSWDKIAAKQVVTPEIIERIQTGVRSHEFYVAGFGTEEISNLNNSDMISNARQWDAVWPDGDMFKSGFLRQALYVSPSRDLVIVIFSVSPEDDSIVRYLRPIATSGLFE